MRKEIKKVIINSCVSCGACQAICPVVFKLNGMSVTNGLGRIGLPERRDMQNNKIIIKKWKFNLMGGKFVKGVT